MENYYGKHLNSRKSMPRPQNFVSAFVNINVCPPPVFGKMFTKSTDPKNRVGPPPPPLAIHNEGGNPMPIYSSIFGQMVMGIDGHGHGP